MKNLKKYAAAILCGGRSQRMGADKAFLRDSLGNLLLAQSAERLATWFGRVLFVTDDPRKLEPYPELAPYAAIKDQHPLSGPVGAIRTALLASPGQAVFVLAGDQPTIELEIILKLRDLLEKTKADVVLPCHEGVIEPLYAFYGSQCAAVFQESLLQNKLAIRQSFPSLVVQRLALEPQTLAQGLFKNLNTPEEAQAMGYKPTDRH
ncbi:MAG: molybdenum cofactor guanylyltransferase [Deltaproteobacteria bacterium]|jgi:molybdopterin-guanine dinucleotide biosynthesis protein A|nr:molybdenum cofactor guanylyltransferase [Deltaproteobacteria bacterium]